MTTLGKWVKIKKKENEKNKSEKNKEFESKVAPKWRQIVAQNRKKPLRHRTFRVIQDIGEIMALDEQGQEYVEVLRKGDIIDGRRFDERFLKVLVYRKLVEILD